VRLKPGEDLAVAGDQLLGAEQSGSGLLRTLVTRDQKDPSQAYILAVFESEKKPRARERDPRRQEGLQAVQTTMADILAGPPEFVDRPGGCRSARGVQLAVDHVQRDQRHHRRADRFQHLDRERRRP
jgi:hypothetical protein